MKFRLKAILAAMLFSAVPIALAQDAATDVKKGAEATGHETKVVAKDTAKGTEKAADKTGHATKVVAKDTAKGTEKVADKTGHETKVVAKDTAKGTEKVAKKTGSVVKKGAEDTGHEMKKAADWRQTCRHDEAAVTAAEFLYWRATREFCAALFLFVRSLFVRSFS